MIVSQVILQVLLMASGMVRASEVRLDPDVGVGSWIWAHETRDRQECRFVRVFEIPHGSDVKAARLRITADNYYQIFLNGQLIGQGADWRVLIEYDVKRLLETGANVLAVSAQNDFDVAGLLVGLRVEFEDGGVLEVPSDASWRMPPADEEEWLKNRRGWRAWPAAKVLYPVDPGYRPQVYQAPVSLPPDVAFWQRKEFQLALSLVAVLSVAAGLFLGSRLLLKSQMEKVVRRERARIALDLHDELGGGLTQLVLLGETSRRELPPDSRMAVALSGLCDQSRGLLRGMNEVVWLINSRRDTIRDFASYVGKYAEGFFQNTSVRCRFDIEDELPPMACDIGTRRNLFLAMKEAFNNVLKHSGATMVELKIHRQRNELVVVIRDNGRGFDPEKENSTGNGLRNMALRTEEAGGRFKVDGRRNEGCTLEFRIPLQRPMRFRGRRFFHLKGKGDLCE